MTEPDTSNVDAVVVGAGFAGLYQLHRLRESGLSTRVFEAGGDVGGTWYWNRYPGARCDVPSLDYSYSFDEDLRREWRWTERYAAQPEILGYLRHVADRFNLSGHITFNTRVESCVYDSGKWRVTTDSGEVVDTQFVIMATGCLSRPKELELPGAERFTGRSLYTFRWPHEPVDLSGDRVGLIGTGSSAVQSIPLLARDAAELTVFQRTPTYVLPAGNRPLTDGEIEQFVADFEQYRPRARESGFGVPVNIDPRSALEVRDTERTARYEELWGNGLIDLVSAYADLLIDERANDTAAGFVRDKITGLVRDPKLADTLSPRYALGCKRPCLDNTDTGYYEVYNNPNVTLVDVRTDPLLEITESGIRTAARAHEFDTIVYATGFDALTGALAAIDIRGRKGIALSDHWAEGPRTYLGLGVAGFPNLFTVTGPLSPSVVTNMVISIEDHVELVIELIATVCARGLTEIEPAVAAEEDWCRHAAEVADMTLYPQTESWYTGANIAGKARGVMMYVGGLGPYRQICADMVERDYSGWVLR